MLPFLFLCLVVSALGQSTTNIESEDDNNSQASPVPQRPTYYSSYLPAAQQRRPVYNAPVPRVPETYSYAPYSFNYMAQGDDGSSSRQETGDASGRVVGSYTISVDDGRRRVVEYVADQDGFRATIDSNEPGTDLQNPASVVFHSAGIGRDNQQTVVPRPIPPQTAYRPRPSRIYSQPAVVQPVYHNHREEVYSPYRYYDNHAYDHYRHRGYGSYYNNDHSYYYGH